MRTVAVSAVCSLGAFGQEAVVARDSFENDVTVFDAPHWKRLGRAASDATVMPTFMLRHGAHDLKEFEKTFYAVSTPGNSQYGQHLTKQQVAELLPPVPGSKEAVLNLLAAHNVHDVEPFDDMVKATIAVEVAERIFETQIFEYQHENGMKVLRAGAPYSLPTGFGAIVYNAADLVQLPALDGVELIDDVSASPSAFLGTSFPKQCGSGCEGKVTPDVLAALYDYPAYDPAQSSATTMAVSQFQGVSWDSTDLDYFGKQCEAPFSIAVDRQVGSNQQQVCHEPGASSICVEALLDVEYIKGVAGDIPLTVVSSEQYSLANWAQQVRTMENPPALMSVSYGNDEIQQTSGAFMDSASVQFQKIGAMGISILFASGDQGVVGRTGHTSDGKYHPGFPAASPYITAVGGTDLATKSVIGAEKAWSSGGGGFSDHFGIPEYQASAVAAYLKESDAAGLTPPDTAFTRSGRGFPDLSAMAGQQNPYCIAAAPGYDASTSMIGVAGTSASCPVVAGLFARLNAARAAQGKPNMGFLNPFIYQNPDAFKDVTLGSVTGAAGVTGFSAMKGWDAATGMGTPNFPKLMDAAMAAATVVV